MSRTPVLTLTTGALVAALAAPAFAHASFPSSAVFGFAPNTAGGTGATSTVAPPYAAGVRTQIVTRVPYEQTAPFNGAPDTTVDVKVVVPAGWTAPTCGSARITANNAGTNNTNQPGAVAPGWTCTLLTVGGRQVLSWTGPQVAAGKTPADSAQYFTFGITTPTPSVQTSYNGLGGTEGFVVDQRYASGDAEHWIPNAAFPGTAPSGAVTTVAGGLVRTVAAVQRVTATIANVNATALSVGDALDVTVRATPGTRVDLRAVFGPWTATRNLRTAVVPASGFVTFASLRPTTSMTLWVAERRGTASAPVTIRVSR